MGFASFYCKPHFSCLNPPCLLSPPGVVRLEQKNDTFLEMGIYDDGPFEAGDENEKNPDLVPAPANSYLGKSHYITSSVAPLSQRSVLKYATTPDCVSNLSFVSVSQASLWTRGRV